MKLPAEGGTARQSELALTPGRLSLELPIRAEGRRQLCTVGAAGRARPGAHDLPSSWGRGGRDPKAEPWTRPLAAMEMVGRRPPAEAGRLRGVFREPRHFYASG